MQNIFSILQNFFLYQIGRKAYRWDLATVPSSSQYLIDEHRARRRDFGCVRVWTQTGFLIRIDCILNQLSLDGAPKNSPPVVLGTSILYNVYSIGREKASRQQTGWDLFVNVPFQFMFFFCWTNFFWANMFRKLQNFNKSRAEWYEFFRDRLKQNTTISI